jgi:hypothetical protein
MRVDPGRRVELHERTGTEKGKAEEEYASLVFVQDVYGTIFILAVCVRRVWGG